MKITSIATTILLAATPLVGAQNPAATDKIKLAASVQAGGSYQLEQLVKTTMSGGK